MKKRLENPQALFGFWLALGTTIGILIGMAINSISIGIITGMCLSLLVGKATYRIAQKV